MAKELNREFFVKTGRKGGQALIKKRGKAYMRKIAQKGGRVRWANHKKAVAA